MNEWVEVVFCPKCGHKIVKDYLPRPNGMYGNKIQCTSPYCKLEFVVTSAIIRDKHPRELTFLEIETEKAFDPQRTLEEFL